MIRSHIALGQLQEVCGGKAPVLRQVAIAAAIVNMLLFEGTINALALSKTVPAESWAIPAGFYVIYLAFIGWALRPMREHPSATGEASRG
jgi:hypothetical protein